MKAVASGDQQRIFQDAQALEALNVTDAPVVGRWSLVFSTQTSGDEQEDGMVGKNSQCWFGSAQETLFSAVTAALWLGDDSVSGRMV